MLYKRVRDMFQQRLKLLKRKIRIDQHFEFKKKQEKFAANNMAREEACINQELTDPNVKELQERITALDKDLVNVNTSTRKSAPSTNQPINKQQLPKQALKVPK